MMIAWWVGVAAPTASLVTRSAVALAVCVAVECSQLLHTPSLDAVRQTTLGAHVLGSGFDVRDLVEYAGGVALAGLLERAARRA
jgi:hypothetical protein